MTTEAELWQKFDRHLFSLKIQQRVPEFHSRLESEKRRIHSEINQKRNSAGLLPALMQLELDVLRDWAGMYDSEARDVWESDGNDITPEFLRMILKHEIMPLIARRREAAQLEWRALEARTRRNYQVAAVCGSFAMALGRFTSGWSRKYEIEARTLVKQQMNEQLRRGEEALRNARAVRETSERLPISESAEIHTKGAAPLPGQGPSVESGAPGTIPAQAPPSPPAVGEPVPEQSSPAADLGGIRTEAPPSGTVSYPETQTEGQARAEVVGKLWEEIKTVRPRMRNESHYENLERENSGFLLFEIAKRDPEVREWVENMQERRDMLNLACEIAARRFKLSRHTLEKDWKRHKKRKTRKIGRRRIRRER